MTHSINSNNAIQFNIHAMKPLTYLKNFIFIITLVFSYNSMANNEIKPFVKGSFKQIQQEQSGSSYIVTFWSETCAYCMKELAVFGRLIKQYPNVNIISITTDPFLDEEVINQTLESKQLSQIQKWVFADDYVERLYFDIDKRWRGELPLTYFFDKNNTMVKHLGVITEPDLIQWFSQQKTDLTQ